MCGILYVPIFRVKTFCNMKTDRERERDIEIPVWDSTEISSPRATRRGLISDERCSYARAPKLNRSSFLLTNSGPACRTLRTRMRAYFKRVCAMRIDLFDRQRHGTAYMTRIQGATFGSAYTSIISNLHFDVYTCQMHASVCISVISPSQLV